MHRRAFVRLLAAVASLKASALDLAAKQRSWAPVGAILHAHSETPAVRVVSAYAAAATPGMPGPYPGRVVAVKSDKCVDTATGSANDAIVREMMARGMRTLTGARTTRDAWRHFFEPLDVVGLKVNCGGYPVLHIWYEIVAEVVRQLIGVGVPVSQIYVYERFQNQMDEVNYAPHLPEGVQIVAAERANRNVDNSSYDPATYLEADLFGEDDTRSNMMSTSSKAASRIPGSASVSAPYASMAYLPWTCGLLRDDRGWTSAVPADA